MRKLPLLSGREVVKVFEHLGWEVARQRGSHIILVKEGSIATLSVPDHDEVARGTLKTLIARADITVEEFLSTIK
jgi:predicted RNA binding protein YcfA (HicA-like mRNA interferase family)